MKLFLLPEISISEAPLNDILFVKVVPVIAIFLKFMADMLDGELYDMLLDDYPP